MRALSDLERYLGSATWQSASRQRPPGAPAGAHRPVITISRQAGAGAHVVAEDLVARLQAQAPKGSPPWTVFDRNLVDRVLQDHDLPSRLARFMPEDRVSEIADTLDELFGLHPSAWTLVRKTADTVLHLAELGHVVVIGRGANIITAKLRHAFHVRLVGSEAQRVEYIREHRHLGEQAAAEYVRDEDLGRMRYLRKYYGEDIDDPLLYDVVINTDRVSYGDAARLIADAVSAVSSTANPSPADPLVVRPAG